MFLHKAVYVLALICAWVVQKNEAQNHVTYGDMTFIEYFPFYAIVAGCGGAIVSDSYIVTSADCANNVSTSRPNVYVGGDDMEEVQVSSVTIHEDFNTDDEWIKRNNIAMLRLENKLEFSDKIQAATLPDDPSADKTGNYDLLTGDGELRYRLQMDRDTVTGCMEYFQEMENTDSDLDTELFCAFRSDERFTYDGYSNGLCSNRIAGSPLVQDDVLRGIYSFSFEVPQSGPCQDPDTYNLDIEYYAPWIRRTMED